MRRLTSQIHVPKPLHEMTPEELAVLEEGLKSAAAELARKADEDRARGAAFRRRQADKGLVRFSRFVPSDMLDDIGRTVDAMVSRRRPRKAAPAPMDAVSQAADPATSQASDPPPVSSRSDATAGGGTAPGPARSDMPATSAGGAAILDGASGDPASAAAPATAAPAPVPARSSAPASSPASAPPSTQIPAGPSASAPTPAPTLAALVDATPAKAATPAAPNVAPRPDVAAPDKTAGNDAPIVESASARKWRLDADARRAATAAAATRSPS